MWFSKGSRKALLCLVVFGCLLFFLSANRSRAAETVTVPDFFPEYDVAVNTNPAGGNVFVAGQVHGKHRSFHCILNNEGDILYYRINHDLSIFDFKPLPERQQMTYFKFGVRDWYVQDMSYEVVDTFSITDEYRTDSHELYFDPDGHAWMIGQNDVPVDMSELVEGGNPEAVVMEMMLQEFDQNGELLFEWHSLPHIPILDADTAQVDLTAEYIDYMHSNSIFEDTDGNIIISSKKLNEITKIDYETGEVIWRMGAGNGNMFTFENDDPNEGFYFQHFAHRLDNGNLLLYDNGTLHDPPVASAKEYEVDEDNLVATRVWSYEQDPPSISYAMGSASRLENDNTLICWGSLSNTDPVMVSEVTPAGETVWQLNFTETGSRKVNCYRAYRSEMEGEASRPYLAYEIQENTVLFYMNHFGADSVTSYQLYLDTSPAPTTLEGVYNTGRIELYYLEAGSYYFARIMSVSPSGVSDYSNEIRFWLDDSPVGEQTNPMLPDESIQLGVWPNPANPNATVQVRVRQPSDVQVSVHNLLGREVDRVHNGLLLPGTHSFAFEGEHLTSGVYFIAVRGSHSHAVVKKLLLLH